MFFAALSIRRTCMWPIIAGLDFSLIVHILSYNYSATNVLVYIAFITKASEKKLRDTLRFPDSLSLYL